MTVPHLLLIDASGFAHRAHHAMAPVYREKDGQPIGAVLGFMGITWRLLGAAEADRPTHGAAVFDAPGKTFRHRLSPDYKANRDPSRRTELAGQLPFMRHAAETLGLRPVEAEGFEADDVIATLARQAVRAGMRVTIVSSDKDFGQMVIDGQIEIFDPLPKRRLYEKDVVRKMGVPPALVPHVQALWGDAVDNIIGVDGVGRDKAAKLVRHHGSIEGVIENAHRETQWPLIRKQLMTKAVAERVRLNLKLATLRKNVKLDVVPEGLALEPIMRSHLDEILKALGAPKWAMASVFALDPQIARVVDHVADPEAWWRGELKMKSTDPMPGMPQSGYFQRRIIKGGAPVGARIWREQHIDAETGQPSGMDVLRCEVDGKARDPFAEWPRLFQFPVAKASFAYDGARADYERKWKPDSPRANPGVPIDLHKQPVPRNPKARKSHV